MDCGLHWGSAILLLVTAANMKLTWDSELTWAGPKWTGALPVKIQQRVGGGGQVFV